jgi:uncharacterized phiE125 gp8 family phage protein
MAYATLAQLKAYLGVQKSTDDELLGAVLDRATAVIEKRLGFSFAASGDTIKTFSVIDDIDPRCGRLLLFRSWLAAAPTLVQTDADGDNLTIPSTDYILVDRTVGPPYYGIKLKDSSPYVWEYTYDHEEGIKVTGKWGWSTTPPDDIVHACVRLGSFMYRQKETGGEADRAAILSDGTMLLPAEIPKDVLAILDKYAWRGGA